MTAGTEQQKKKSPKILLKQPMMRKVIVATIPGIAAAVYFFGWRSLAVVLVSCVFAFFCELLFVRRRNEPVSEAVFVTAILFALILPPGVPWHVLVIGIVFAVFFGKMVFGGFGYNIFNPAMSGRAFVYICFPIALTSRWFAAAPGPLGGLAMWTTGSLPDAVTAATPMALINAGHAAPPLVDFLVGRMPGSMGVTSSIAILIGGIYLFITKTASRHIIVSVILSYVIAIGLFNLIGIRTAPGVLEALFGGGFLFGAFFMATDPITSPRTIPAKIVFAAIAGAVGALIQTFSVFNGGFMFSLLLANMFGPILDFYFNRRRSKKIAAPEPGAA